MKLIKLKNGETGGVALNIEKDISKCFRENIELKEIDLDVVIVRLCDKSDNSFQYTENYIFYKSTKTKFNIKDEYNLFTSDEETNLLRILSPLVESVPYQYIKNYAFINSIPNIWKRYIDEWGMK